MLVGSTGSNFFRFLTCPDWYRKKMPLGVSEKTTPIYSGFPRALLWGINPSAPGPQSAFGRKNSPISLGKSVLHCRDFSCLSPGHWPIHSLEQVPRAISVFSHLYSYPCPLHGCILGLSLCGLGFLTQLLPPESRTWSSVFGLDL